MGKWPLQNASFWETAPFFRLLVPLVAGISLYWCLPPTLVSLVSSCIITVCLVIATTIALYLLPNAKVAIFVGAQLTIVGIGFTASALNDVRQNNHWFGHSIQTNHAYLLRVLEKPIHGSRSCKVKVSVIGEFDNGRLKQRVGYAILYLQERNLPVLYRKGDTIIAPGSWQNIHNSGNPYEFDYAAYLQMHNTFHAQYCDADRVRLFSSNDVDAVPISEKARNWCNRQLALCMSDEQTSGLMQAMLTGDDSHLDPEVKASFTNTGIIHIIVISGGNILLLFTAIGFLLFWVKHRKYFWIKYVIALPLVWFYALMAGGGPSPLRAVAMFTLLSLGMVLQKSQNPLNALFSVAFLLLCFEPQWLFSIGFQLSFVAVLSLLIFGSRLQSLFRPKLKVTRFLWEAFAASLAAEILLWPIIIYYFHHFPILFLVANVFAAIFITILTYGGIILILGSVWLPIGKLLGWSLSLFIKVFLFIVGALQQLSPMILSKLYFSFFDLILVYAITACVALFVFYQHKKWLLSALGIISVLLSFQCYRLWGQLHQRGFAVYNVKGGLYAEYFEGRRHCPLPTDTALLPHIAYETQEAHIRWNTWRKAELRAIPFTYLIGGQSILVLNRPTKHVVELAADVVVVNYAGTVDVPALQKSFHPSLIVVGNSLPKHDLELLKVSCENAHIQLHLTGRDGAWVSKE